MGHKTFFWFMLPTCLAMVLFIAIPIVSIFVQSLFVEHQKPLIEIETCDPFGCKKEVGVDIEAFAILNKEKFSGCTVHYVDEIRQHNSSTEMICKEMNKK